MDYPLNKFSARVSNFDENVSWTSIKCDSLNSNFIVSSKSLAKDKLISTKN